MFRGPVRPVRRQLIRACSIQLHIVILPLCCQFPGSSCQSLCSIYFFFHRPSFSLALLTLSHSSSVSKFKLKSWKEPRYFQQSTDDIYMKKHIVVLYQQTMRVTILLFYAILVELACAGTGNPTKKKRYGAYKETTHKYVGNMLSTGASFQWGRSPAPLSDGGLARYKLQEKMEIYKNGGGFGPLEKANVRHCKRSKGPCEKAKLQWRLMESAKQRRFSVYPGAATRAGSALLVPFAAEAFHALKKLDNPIGEAILVLDDTIATFQDSFVEALPEQFHRRIHGNAIKLWLICWMKSWATKQVPHTKTDLDRHCEWLAMSWEEREAQERKHREALEQAKRSREAREKTKLEHIYNALNVAVGQCQDMTDRPPVDARPENLFKIVDICSSLIRITGVARRLTDLGASDPCLACVLDLQRATPCVCAGRVLPARPKTPYKLLRMLDPRLNNGSRFAGAWVSETHASGFQPHSA